MKYLNDCSDERLKGGCAHCGASMTNEPRTSDHIPSKVLLNSPYPENLMVVDACKKCNKSFSTDEEYAAAFLASVISGSSKPDASRFPSAAMSLNRSPILRSRIEQSRTIQKAPGSEDKVIWRPELDRIERVIVKNARGHAFYELGEPMLEEPTFVHIGPITELTPEQLDEFGTPHAHITGWPEVGSRHMQRIASDLHGPGGWVEVQRNAYRYAVDEFATVRIVLQEYLAALVGWS